MIRPLLLILLFAHYLYSGVLRHNEQGLSPTHTYTAGSTQDVVSNVNGNLVFRDVAAGFSRPDGVGIVVERTYNSHWRDPLLAHQFDMDFKDALTIDSSVSRDKDTKVYPMKGPKYRDVNPRFSDNHVFAGGLGEEVRYYRDDIGNAYANMALMSATMDMASAGHDIWSGIQNEDPTTPQTGDPYVNASGAVLQFVSLSLNVMNMYENFDDFGFDNTEQGERTLFTFTAATVSAVSLSNTLTKVFTADHVGFLQKSVTNKWDYTTVSSNGWGVALASVGFAVQVWSIARDPSNATAMDYASLALSGIATFNAIGSFASTAFIPIPGVQAASLALAMIQLGIAIKDMIDAKNAVWDVADIRIRPWQVSVNGYSGMIGNKYQNQLSMLSKDGSEVVKRDTSYTTISFNMALASSKPFLKKVRLRTIFERRKSSHPMQEMFLVKSDGSAARWVLAKGDSLSIPNATVSACPTGSATVRGYVSLSNVETSEVLWVDCAGNGSDNDTSDYYLVKDGNGTWAMFGKGEQAKGVRATWVNTSTTLAYASIFEKLKAEGRVVVNDIKNRSFDVIYDGFDSLIQLDQLTLVDRHSEPYEAFWALPVRFGDYFGDTVRVERDSVGKITSILHNRDSRSIEIAGNEYRVVENGNVLSATKYTELKHKYVEGRHRKENTVDMVTEISRKVNSDQWLTTTLSYYNGNLSQIQSPNGSKATYTFTDALQESVLDGYLLRKTVESGKRKESWIYTYNGLGNDGKTTQPVQHTVIKHELIQPGLDGETLRSETQEVHTYRQVYSGVTVQTDPCIVDNINPQDSGALKLVEYRTGRFQELSALQGLGGQGNHVGWEYQGDLRSKETRATTLDARWVEPSITSWQYDEWGNPILEAVNSTEDIQAWRTHALAVASGLIDSIAADSSYLVNRMDTSEAGVKQFQSTAKAAGLDFDSLSFGPMDRLTAKGWWNLYFGAFFFDKRDTTSDTLVKISRRVNSAFKINAPRILSVPRYELMLRLVQNEVDTAASGTYGWTGFVDVQGRIRNRQLFVNGDTTMAEETGYVSENSRKPLWRKIYADSANWVLEKYAYDSYSNRVSTRRNIAWNNEGFHSESILLDSARFDALGRQIAKCDASGACVQTEYDLLGRPIQEVQPDGAVRTLVWHDVADGDGFTGFTEKHAGGDSTRVYFDGLGRLNKVVRMGGGESETRRVVYGIFDKLLVSEDGAKRRSYYGYDAVGRLTSVKVPVDSGKGYHERNYTYDSRKRTYTETDEFGTRTVFYHDKEGRDLKIEVYSATGTTPLQTVRNWYDNEGRLLMSQDPEGNYHKSKFDVQGRPMREEGPEGIVAERKYDLAGNVQWERTQSSTGKDSVAFKIDGAFRPLQSVWFDEAGHAVDSVLQQWDTRPGYSRKGMLVGMQGPRGLALQNTFDAMGRPVSVDRKVSAYNGRELYRNRQSFSYTTDGLLSGLDVGQGAGQDVRLGWSHDGLRRIRSGFIAKGTDTLSIAKVTARDASGLVTGIELGNHTKINYQYETDRPLVKKAVATRGTNAHHWQLGLRYDARGDVERMDRPHGERVLYNHDALRRLSSATYSGGGSGKDGTEATYVWEHGKDGRRLGFTHQFGKDTVKYLGAGGMPTEHRLADGLVRKIEYDYRGNRRLVRTYIQNDTAENKWIREEKMDFDARDGLRGFTKITRSAEGELDTVSRYYVLDERGWRIAELDGDSTVLKKWVYRGNYVAADSGSTDGPINANGWKYYNGLGEQAQGVGYVNGQGKLEGRWYLTDHLGSVTAVEDSAGNRMLTLALDPWGNLESAKGKEGAGYVFTGKLLDGVLGGTDHGARVLDNRMGMWWGRDPMKMEYNAYAYAFQNPLFLLDADGMKPGPGLMNNVMPSYGPWDIAKPLEYDVDYEAAPLTSFGKDALALVHYFTGSWANITGNVLGATNSATFGNIPQEVMDQSMNLAVTIPGGADDLFVLTVGALREGAMVGKMNAMTKGLNNSNWQGKILNLASSGNGNFGLGSATYEQTMAAGKAWVGDGFRIASDGKTMVSASGLKQFRPPSFKPKLNKTQANFESRIENKGPWTSNGHLDVIGDK